MFCSQVMDPMLFVHNRAEKTDFGRVIEPKHISAYLLQLISINSMTGLDRNSQITTYK